MKIRKIQTIKKYKSFLDFSWGNFCNYHFLDKLKNTNTLREAVLDKFVLIFGENGSGKSTTCDILKSLSQNQDFQNTSPELAEIEIENGTKQVYKFENNK